MSRPSAFTILEFLVALAVFVIVLVMAYSASTQTLQINRDNEAISSAQAKIRRVLEVLSQDLRSSALGIVTNAPYGSNTTGVSYAQLKRGAGYSVSAISGSTFNIVSTSTSTEIAQDFPNNTRLVIVDNNGSAVVTRATAAPSSAGSNTYQITTSCNNLGIALTSETLAFPVNLQGYSYDSTGKKLVYMQQGDASATDAAYDITNFRIDYVYASSTGLEVRNPTGYLSGGNIQIQFTNGATYSLRRLQFVLSTQIPSRGRNIERTYTGQVDLVNTRFYTAKVVTACNP